MKIYNKPTDQNPLDKELFELLEDEKIEINGMELDEAESHLSDEDQRLNALLSDAKVEFDETWMAEAMDHVPADFDMRLQATLDALQPKEETNTTSPAPVIDMTIRKQVDPPQIGQKLWKRVAACIAIILALGVGYNMHGSNNAFADTCKTPEEAQQQLERALSLLNTHTNKAIDMADETLQQATAPRQRDLSKYISFE